jgi:DNA-binding NarL/FixJ family response regulator
MMVEVMTSHGASRIAVDRARGRLGLMLTELSPRQRQVLELIGRGKPNKLIAHELEISENTVKAHLRQIMKRLHVTNRTEAALMALGQDLDDFGD